MIYDYFGDVNKFYLCADIHNFQNTTVTINHHVVRQFICGTGGADLDLEPSGKPLVDNRNGFQVQSVVHHAMSTYGYFKGWMSQGDIFQYDFIPVVYEKTKKKEKEISKGGRKKRKTKKYKK
jgi:hypothetical protein